MYQEEINVLIDALNEYANGADEYEGEEDVTQYADVARELVARAEVLRELPEEQLAMMVNAAQALASA